MLKTQGNVCVENETKELTSQYQNKLEFTENPAIAEFLGFQEDASHYELNLEESIIDALQKYFINFGKGYALVARQQRIHTEKEDCSIDLVFYNYILKCFVLIDLKTEKITYQISDKWMCASECTTNLKSSRTMVRHLVLCFVQILMRTLSDIQYSMEMNSYLHQNTSNIFLRKKNCELKLKYRKISII